MNDNKATYDRIIAYRNAMIADGWEMTPNYKGEPLESYAHGTKGEWVCHVEARDFEQMKVLYPATYRNARPPLRYMCGVHIWAPDGCCVTPPETYSWGALVAGTRTCAACGKTDVETHRYSFAGRCCAACLPEMRRQHEFPGWCD